MPLPTHLRTFIIGSSDVSAQISTRCHYNANVPEYSSKPFVWFRTNTDNEELTLDGTGGLHEAYVDLECVANTETAAQATADAVKARLHGHRGTVGSVTAKGVFVSDKDDDYLPYMAEANEGAHIVSYTVRMWYTT